MSFNAAFRLVRSEAMKRVVGDDDRVIHPGDFIVCDVGIHYLRLHTDHQQWAYVLWPGEQDAPEGMKKLMAEANRLQDIFMSEFR